MVQALCRPNGAGPYSRPGSTEAKLACPHCKTGELPIHSASWILIETLSIDPNAWRPMLPALDDLYVRSNLRLFPLSATLRRSVMTFGAFISRVSRALIAGSLAFTLIFAAVHAAEDQRKVTVVSFGLFGGQGVFRREATGAAEIVANRFGADQVVVRFNTKTGGDATVEALAATLQAEAKKMNGGRDVLFLILTSH